MVSPLDIFKKNSLEFTKVIGMGMIIVGVPLTLITCGSPNKAVVFDVNKDGLDDIIISNNWGKEFIYYDLGQQPDYFSKEGEIIVRDGNQVKVQYYMHHVTLDLEQPTLDDLKFHGYSK